MAERLGEMALAHPDRVAGDDPFPGGDELEPGQVADLGGGQLGVVAEVEALQGGLLGERGGPDPPGDLAGLAAGELVLAQDLEELGVAEGTRPRQRKVVTPNDFTDLDQIRDRLAAFQTHYNAVARPFNWKFTRTDLNAPLERIDAHQAQRPPQLAA